MITATTSRTDSIWASTDTSGKRRAMGLPVHARQRFDVSDGRVAPQIVSTEHERLSFPVDFRRPSELDLRVVPRSQATFEIAIVSTLSTGRNVYFPDDSHWNAAGHEVAARALARLLRAKGL